MALTTRCPQCATTFRVAADQLRIRNGLVRCGVCASVFDGREYLDELAAVALPPQSPAHRPAPAQPQAPIGTPGPMPTWGPARTPAPVPDVLRRRADAPFRIERTEPRVAHDDAMGGVCLSSYAAPPAMAASPAHHAATDDASAYAEAQPMVGEPPVDATYEPRYRREDTEDDVRDDDAYAPAGLYGERKSSDDVREPGLYEPADDGDRVRGEPRTRYVDDFHSGRTPPSFMDDGARAQRTQRSRLWGAGCVLLLVVLMGLLLYTYRNQVAASVPTLRPALEAACRPLACTVGYERRVERISIMSSSLRAPPGGATSGADTQDLMLTVVLRNRYSAPQPWPSLTLELKDIADRVVVRKNLRPTDYLPADVAAQPFGANVERRVTVPIAVRDVQVNGYQIDKFFP